MSARTSKARRTNVPGTIYLLHFDAPISSGHTTQHYIGWAEDLAPRINAHRSGAGARLTEIAKERGIGFTVVRTWHGTRNDERKLKNRHEAPRMCPCCNPNAERIAVNV